MFKIDELTKKHIWKKNKRKQKWTKLRYIDLFLLVLSVYCPCFFILHSVLNPDFTYFYGPYGNITTYGRVMTMIIRTSIVYISTSIPSPTIPPPLLPYKLPLNEQFSIVISFSG